MALYLKPHSPEWFAALEKFDAYRATVFRASIKRAGSTEVCGICGDIAAADYRRTENNLPEDAVATIRLCKHCLAIWSGTFQEQYEPWRGE